VTGLVGELRGEQPPAEPYDRHKAAARAAGQQPAPD
jgi:hypothetical protein